MPGRFVARLAADVLIDGGRNSKSLAPPLLQNAAATQQSRPGQPGRCKLRGIRVNGVPRLDRRQSVYHAMGNPHFMVDPILPKAVAQHIANAFAASFVAR